MIAPEQRRMLCDAVGDDAVTDAKFGPIDGVAPELTVAPTDGEAVSRALGALDRCGLTTVVRGGGNRFGVGNLPGRIDTVMSTERMAGIDELDASDGVCRARAGTLIRNVSDAARTAGWEFPLESIGEGATVGGCIAAATYGPRAQGFGLPRDLLLGLDVCLGSGERTRCGGRVVKNVTGYDLNKLYTGSFGSLGVIESAWLRLKPKPESVECRVATFDALEVAGGIAIETSRRSTARVSAIERNDSSDWRVVVEFAGDAASVTHDVAWIEGRNFDATPADAIDSIARRQASLGSGEALRFRVGVRPSKLTSALATLAADDGDVLGYPGLATVWVGYRLDPAMRDGEVARRFELVGRIARDSGSTFVCESAPTWAKRGREMFSGAEDQIDLFCEIKQRFDPKSILNPGRFAGGL